ncbi:hypothetical protein E3T39_00025 [Cryobacterium suzukii]|uniref:Polysaccharide biosynthesis protein C-terminal domain-containing protein n=1 Tax=Cryobacterium suzukii TaxID=1259198 RepID=A0A4R9AK09_9MICO|nr:hypothetical protein [Cryobacterium suzukii]TFD63136.1 hypothetical protein E3T39_00025 [Cryobacterium suzukii]
MISVAVAIVAFSIAFRLLPGLGISAALLAVSAIIPQAYSVLSGAILRGNGRLASGTFAELGSMPALAVAILLTKAMLSELSLTDAIIALSVSSWLTAAWAIPAAIRSVRIVSTEATAGASSQSIHDFLKRYLGRMIAMMGTSLLFYFLTWAPLFVLFLTSSPDDVAFFTVAARLAAFIGLVSTIQVSYLAPAFARLYHRSELQVLNDLCNRSAWQAGIAAVVPTVVFVVASQPLLELLYGAGFSNAAVPLVLLTIAAFLNVVIGQVNQLMLLCELERTALILNLVWLAAWLAAGLWLSSLGGVVAASGFALVSGVLYSVLAARQLAKSRGVYSFLRKMPPLMG